MSGNTRKNQVTRLVTLRHRSTMSGALDTRAGQLHGSEADARDREITQSVAVHGTHTSGQRSFADLAEQAEEQWRTRRRQLAHRTLPS